MDIARVKKLNKICQKMYNIALGCMCEHSVVIDTRGTFLKSCSLIAVIGFLNPSIRLEHFENIPRESTNTIECKTYTQTENIFHPTIIVALQSALVQSALEKFPPALSTAIMARIFMLTGRLLTQRI